MPNPYQWPDPPCRRSCTTRRTLVAGLLARAEENEALRGATGCGHMLGTLPCVNGKPHKGNGAGCVHVGGTVDDRRAEAPT